MRSRTILAILIGLGLPAFVLLVIYQFILPEIASREELLQELVILDGAVGIVVAYVTLVSLFVSLLLKRVEFPSPWGTKKPMATGKSLRAFEPIRLRVILSLTLFAVWWWALKATVWQLSGFVVAFALGVGVVVPTLYSISRRGSAFRTITDEIGTFKVSGPWRKTRRKNYTQRLKRVLGEVVGLSLRVPLWRRLTKSFNQPTVLLFVPNASDDSFVLLECTSSVRRFEEKIAPERKPPMLDFAGVCEIYERFRRAAETGEPDSQEQVRQFRNATRTKWGTCAVVAEYGQPFIFEDVYSKCLTFDFDFLQVLDRREDQKKLEFQHLVGIPARYAGNLMGVLLLLSDSTAQFVRDPRFYDQLIDVLGHAIHTGFVTRSLPERVLAALSTTMAFERPGQKHFRSLVRSMNHQFDTRIDERLLKEYLSTADRATRRPTAHQEQQLQISEAD